MERSRPQAHLHHGAEVSTVSNVDTGETLCVYQAKSQAGLWHRSHLSRHIESMNTCAGDDLGSLSVGDTVRQVSEYNSMHANPGAMSITMMFVGEPN